MGSYSYCASGRQLASWYGGSTQLEYDVNQEPTAADHGDVLYTIGRSTQLEYDVNHAEAHSCRRHLYHW
jgi:hypothetical protein